MDEEKRGDGGPWSIGGAMTFPFERLEVWQRAVDFAVVVYRSTASFPADERFGLTSQLRRAAASISANIAEGNSKSSGKDAVRFFEISFGSLMEVMSHLQVAKRLGFISEEGLGELRVQAEALARMLSGLRRSRQPGTGR
jgi:four helix bundle protein